MIYVTWVFKGCAVESNVIEKPFLQRNCAKIRDDIEAGIIKPPENYDRFTITPTEHRIGAWLG